MTLKKLPFVRMVFCSDLLRMAFCFCKKIQILVYWLLSTFYAIEFDFSCIVMGCCKITSTCMGEPTDPKTVAIFFLITICDSQRASSHFMVKMNGNSLILDKKSKQNESCFDTNRESTTTRTLKIKGKKNKENNFFMIFFTKW